MTLGTRCSFVPPYLLERIAASDPVAADSCRATLARDQALRNARVAESAVAAAGATAGPATGQATAAAPTWVVHTARNGSALPGAVVRSAGDPASGDDTVDEAAGGITATLALYLDAFARASYDGRGAEVTLTVHYEQDYDNAFWNGTQLVFGDGDGEIFGSFTRPIDVLGHEFTHAVTQFTANLTYQGQPGALNESMSDCLGICVKQRVLGQTAASADWLIGEGIFLPGVQARALRDMAHPGTAYDDPRLGQDPQVGDMSAYVETADDNGGVHTNSGIPNRAFYLAATAIGGDTWEGAGRIWYDALTGGQVSVETDFAGFAAATVAAAGDHAAAVEQAWSTVGVAVADRGAAVAVGGSMGGSMGGAVGGGGEGSAPTMVRVRRTGGVAGRTLEGAVDVAEGGPRATAVRDLADRLDLRGVAEPAPVTEGVPDAFSYTFEIGGRSMTVPQHHLTDDQRALADLVLVPPT